MEVGPVFICDHQSCGKSFPSAGALNCHKRSCLPSRKRLQSALAKGKELWEARKRACTVAAKLAKEGVSSSVQTAVNRLPPLYNVRVMNTGPGSSPISSNAQTVCKSLVRNPPHVPSHSSSLMGQQETPSPQEAEARAALLNESQDVTSDLPLANRRSRRENRQPPARYRDTMPQNQPSGKILSHQVPPLIHEMTIQPQFRICRLS